MGQRVTHWMLLTLAGGALGACAAENSHDNLAGTGCVKGATRACICENSATSLATCDEAGIYGACYCSDTAQVTIAADADTDSVSDPGAATTDPFEPVQEDTETEPIAIGCAACPFSGDALGEMACAIDLCSTDVVVDLSYRVLTNITPPSNIKYTRATAERFGATNNGLAPRLGNTYALMSTGFATSLCHNIDLGLHNTYSPTSCYGDLSDTDTGTGTDTSGDWDTSDYGYSAGIVDPYNPKAKFEIYDAVEWRLVLKAPAEAQSFRFKYVFFSAEYDEFIGTMYNDKFYVMIKAGSTNGGTQTIINFTDCRAPNAYSDFVCQTGDSGCVPGQKYCYIAVNTAYSDCCWFGGCKNVTKPKTNISGTGFECASGRLGDDTNYGSSTGWIQTAWPITGGETFEIVFHAHDTNDAAFDSEVLLDAFEFLKKKEQGTVPVI